MQSEIMDFFNKHPGKVFSLWQLFYMTRSESSLGNFRKKLNQLTRYKFLVVDHGGRKEVSKWCMKRTR